MIISLDKYKATGGGGEKPTEVLTQTITANGSQTFNPKTGYVFSKATITTDIHPTEALVATISENGIRHFYGEYNGADITVNVDTFTPTGNIDINANGSYDVTNYATANVNVQVSAKNYSYFDGVIDTEGLRTIGWDDESIGMYRDNERHYASENNYYIVSEENKALNGVIVDKTSIQNNKDNLNFKYCPFFDTSNVTDMSNMFNGCRSLISIPKIDTSKVTSMIGAFTVCSSLTTIPHIDTTKVTNMYRMFNGCRSLTTIPLLNTSNVTDMGYMFNGCTWFTSIPQIDTTNVTNMEYIFSKCTSLTSIPQIDTSKVTSMYAMFDSCSSLLTIPQINTTNVTNMEYMFNGCRSLTSIPLLDTTNVTSMEYIFSGCKSLKYLGGFKNLSISVTSYFLEQCPKLTVESLMNVINNLATVSGKTLSFGSTNLNKLTAEQIAIATNKGWTLS